MAAHPRAYAGWWPRRGGAERCSQGGPDGGRGNQISPPLPFPSAQSPVPRPPKSPSPQRERFFLWVRSKFIGLSQLSGPPGFVVPPSRPPCQGREPEDQPNYNPHNAPRASASPPPAVLPLPARWPAPEDPQRETGCSINLGTPPPALPLAPISLGLITRVPQVDRPLVTRSKWGWGGPGPPPPPPPSPLIHGVREEAVAWRTVAMAARAVRCGRCGASESARGRSLGTSPACGGREARGFVWREGEVALKRTGD